MQSIALALLNVGAFLAMLASFAFVGAMVALAFI